MGSPSRMVSSAQPVQWGARAGYAIVIGATKGGRGAYTVCGLGDPLCPDIGLPTRARTRRDGAVTGTPDLRGLGSPGLGHRGAIGGEGACEYSCGSSMMRSTHQSDELAEEYHSRSVAWRVFAHMTMAMRWEVMGQWLLS